MRKAILKWTMLAVLGLASGFCYVILTPAVGLTGEIAACNCPCENEAPHLHPTPLCDGGLGWFSTPCKGSDKGDCIDHNCQGAEYFYGCLE